MAQAVKFALDGDSKETPGTAYLMDIWLNGKGEILLEARSLVTIDELPGRLSKRLKKSPSRIVRLRVASDAPDRVVEALVTKLRSSNVRVELTFS